MKDNKLSKIIEWGVYLLVFLLPWQVRYIWKAGELVGGFWEYGTFSLYGTELVLLALVLINLIRVIKEHFSSNDLEFFSNISNRKGLRVLIYAITLFFVMACLTIFWAGDSGLALYGLVTMLEGFLLFWLVVSSGVKIKRLAWVIVLSGVVQAGIGIWQFLAQEIQANKWLGIAAKEPFDLGVSVVETVLRRWLRAHGSLPHPNILGGWLVLGLVSCLGLYERIYRKVSLMWDASNYLESSSNTSNDNDSELSQMSSNISNNFSILILWLCYVVMLFGLLMTFSRGAWVAFAIVLLFFCFVAFSKRDAIRRVICYKLLVISLIVVGMFGFIFQEPFLTRVMGRGRLEVQSNVERVGSLEEGMGVVKDNWLKGVGMGNYTLYLYMNEPREKEIFLYPEFSNFLNEDDEQRMVEKKAWDYQPVHNVWFLAWSELGIFGLVFFGLIFLMVALQARRRRLAFSLLLTIFILSLFDHYFWSLYFGIMMWWLVLGLSLKAAVEEGGEN